MLSMAPLPGGGWPGAGALTGHPPPGRSAIDSMRYYTAVAWDHDKAHRSTTLTWAIVVELWASSWCHVTAV